MQIKNTKAPRHWPLWGEFTGDRWIPRTKGQWHGKCFHLMTSSWSNVVAQDKWAFTTGENKIVIAIPCQINGMWFDGTVSNVMHLLSNWDIYGWDHVGQLVPALLNPLTHWGRDKLDAIFYTTFSNGFSWMKMCEFRLEFHWSLFLRFQLIIFQHWLR